MLAVSADGMMSRLGARPLISTVEGRAIHEAKRQYSTNFAPQRVRKEHSKLMEQQRQQLDVLRNRQSHAIEYYHVPNVSESLQEQSHKQQVKSQIHAPEQLAMAARLAAHRSFQAPKVVRGLIR